MAAAVASNRTDPTVTTATSPLPATVPTGEPPFSKIARLSAAAASAVAGPPLAQGEVVGTTTAAAQSILDEMTTPSRTGGVRHVVPPSTTSPRERHVPDVGAWWVQITRQGACSPDCMADIQPVTYVSVLLRASDLRVLRVKDLGSDSPDLALAGPVYPLVLPGQSLPTSQPAVREPVVSASTIEAEDLRGDRCTLPAHLTGLRDALSVSPGDALCTSISVRLYPDWAALASTLPGMGEPGLAFAEPSRPIYYATVWGQLGFAPLARGAMVTSPELAQGQEGANPHGMMPAPAYVDHDNGIYDAITGKGKGGGTAGEPLP